MVMESGKVFKLPWTSKQNRKEEGHVFIVNGSDGVRSVHVHSYLNGQLVCRVTYCQQSELQGLIAALQQAQSELNGS